MCTCSPSEVVSAHCVQTTIDSGCAVSLSGIAQDLFKDSSLLSNNEAFILKSFMNFRQVFYNKINFPAHFPSYTFARHLYFALILSTVVPCSYAIPTYTIFAATLFCIASKKNLS